MRKKGFTLVELLVVIAIIALLMGILMPALARVRMIAYRMVCGSNMSGIGKALLLYAGDSQEAYPMPGWTALPVLYALSGTITNFGGADAKTAFQSFTGGAGNGGAATIGSLFYMLIKYQDVSPKQFICKGDTGSEVFKLTSYTTTSITDLTKVYDFGTSPGKHCSYAYHFPFAKNNTGTPSAGYPISVSSAPSSPLAADRNPGLDKNAKAYISGGDNGGVVATVTPAAYSPCTGTTGAAYAGWTNNNSQYVDKDFVFNSYAHQREGQNVLYNDGHVKFESTANVGINNDNIYQRWGSGVAAAPATVVVPDKGGLEACGRLPLPGSYPDIVPWAAEDALLVNDIPR
jgi:prepilin-type N-terminal cleavage/methylation domain-containing protein